jgi:hypothetical protein
MSATPPATEPPNETEQALPGDFPGVGAWFAEKAPPEVKAHLGQLEKSPIGRSQLNQFLHLCHEPGVSAGFFEYYWVSVPDSHT